MCSRHRAAYRPRRVCFKLSAYRATPLTNEDLEADFPLGDGSAATDAVVYCPYCNESVEITLDPGSGPAQQYVEDCEVCCQPWMVNVLYRDDGEAEVRVTALDE